jgi:hypothetical protein
LRTEGRVFLEYLCLDLLEDLLSRTDLPAQWTRTLIGLKQACFLCPEDNGLVFLKVTYSRPKSSTGTAGRLHSSNSLNAMTLQTISSVLRVLLTPDLYFDIDQVNAYPRILQQICKCADISTPYLTEYIESAGREKILARIVAADPTQNLTRSGAKKLVLSITHGGNAKNQTKIASKEVCV